MMKCEMCGKEFKSLYYVGRHMRQVHGITLGPLKRGPKSEGTFVCHYCGGNWTRKVNLKKHLRLIHYELISGPTQFSIDCPYEFCGLKFLGTKRSLTDDVRLHIMKDHSVGDVAFIKKLFSNSQEFKEWKEMEERVEQVKFIQTRGLTKYSNKTVSHLYCNRSAFTRKPISKRKHIKSGKFCPAKITAVTCIDTGQVNVKYFNIHIGHKNNPQSSYNKKVKRNKELFDSGVICEIVLDNISESVETGGELIPENILQNQVEEISQCQIEVIYENSDSNEWKDDIMNDSSSHQFTLANSNYVDIIIDDGS